MINRALVRNGKPFAPVALDELEILPGVADALLKLRDAGFLNVVVTNQPDLATGKQSAMVLAQMHDQLMTELALDAIKVCPHVDADRCACRKPQAGLLLDAARELDIDLAASYMVGDRWRDITAGQRAGCRCFFIDSGYDEDQPQEQHISVQSLAKAVDKILSDSDTIDGSGGLHE